ncbi:MAG: phosphate ABC transporter permease PstA [Armatimonadota bacterium]|nr:MAG: phosphate ABC transporter permease PstA [Armatimonadota bacterium]
MRPRATQAVVFAGLWAAAAVVVLPVVGILALMFIRGGRALSWELLSSAEEGLLPAIVGTMCLVALTALIAAPLGIAAAVYLSEYARSGPLVRLIRLAIVNLAGVPSVVYGLFGLGLFVMLLAFGRCLLAGACTLALLVLPLVITASEEALRQVPGRLREASFGLGATRWQTVRRVVLPNALPGMMTGLILSVGRAAGETAPILFTAAFISLTKPFPSSALDPIEALPFKLYYMATEAHGVSEEVKWATAAALVMLVLAMNLAAVVIRARLRGARRW